MQTAASMRDLTERLKFRIEKLEKDTDNQINRLSAAEAHLPECEDRLVKTQWSVSHLPNVTTRSVLFRWENCNKEKYIFTYTDLFVRWYWYTFIWAKIVISTVCYSILWSDFRSYITQVSILYLPNTSGMCAYINIFWKRNAHTSQCHNQVFPSLHLDSWTVQRQTPGRICQ